MKQRNKHILLGIVIGIFCTTLVFFLIGDVDIETEFKFGEKSAQENENVKVNIDKEISYIDTIKVEDIKALSIDGKEIISNATETIKKEKIKELLKVEGITSEITFTPSGLISKSSNFDEAYDDLS